MLVDIVVYDGIDEMDALGPLEVLRNSEARGARVTRDSRRTVRRGTSRSRGPDLGCGARPSRTGGQTSRTPGTPVSISQLDAVETGEAGSRADSTIR